MGAPDNGHSGRGDQPSQVALQSAGGTHCSTGKQINWAFPCMKGSCRHLDVRQFQVMDSPPRQVGSFDRPVQQRYAAGRPGDGQRQAGEPHPGACVEDGGRRAGPRTPGTRKQQRIGEMARVHDRPFGRAEPTGRDGLGNQPGRKAPEKIQLKGVQGQACPAGGSPDRLYSALFRQRGMVSRETVRKNPGRGLREGRRTDCFT